MKEENTIVSAFFYNVNSITKDYYNYGRFLVQSNVKKIIFVDEKMFQEIGNDYNQENTRIIKTNNQKYLHSFCDSIKKFDIHGNSMKDTLEYIFLMNYKTEWIRDAIEWNPFHTNHFIWIDFGIKHVSKLKNQEFVEKINQFQYRIYNNIRIAGIWNMEQNTNKDIYKDVFWYFAGGIFGGRKEELIQFANDVKEKCIKVIREKETLMWEVNIWYLVYKDNSSLFSIYSADHNDSLILNY